MKKYIFICLFVLVCLFCTSGLAYASVDVPEYIKVGLYYGSKGVDSFTLSSPTGLEVGTRNGSKFKVIETIDEGETITLKKGDDDYSVYIKGIGDIGDEDNIVRVIPIENKRGDTLISVNGTKYRGEVEVRRFSDSDMTVINVVTMQEYLYGVVPREIGGDSPTEAVKAQAILARTYATKNYNKRSYWGYNMNPTTDDQAYGGYTWEREKSNKAVDETEGMVVTYEDKLIGGYYFSTSGGYTESCENVWGSEIDYLEAVADPYEPTNLSLSSWEVTLTADDVKAKLAARNIDIGDIKNIVATKFSDVGRVTELKIIGTKDTYILNKEKTRTYLGLYSQWYTVNDEPPKAITTLIDDKKEEEKDDVPVEKTVKPLLQKMINILTVKEEKSAVYEAYSSSVSKFVIRGRGWGHAVGMSQNGAIGMAKNNFTYEEIIKWYYTGVEVEE